MMHRDGPQGEQRDPLRLVCVDSRPHRADDHPANQLGAAVSAQTFTVVLRAEPGADGVRALRALLKAALRRHGLRALDVREERATRADRRRRGTRGLPRRWRDKGEMRMALGKRRGLEPMLPILKYDGRIGRHYVQDRVFNGSEWQTEQHDVTDGFRGIFDLPNAEAGWIAFPKGSPPEAVLFPAGGCRGRQFGRNGVRPHRSRTMPETVAE
jgi:hypothetical protein